MSVGEGKLLEEGKLLVGIAISWFEGQTVSGRSNLLVGEASKVDDKLLVVEAKC